MTLINKHIYSKNVIKNIRQSPKICINYIYNS